MAILVDGTAISFLVMPPAGGSPSNIIVTTGLVSVNTLEFSTEFDAAGGPQLIEFRISDSGIARAGISIDDMFSKPVPEPTSMTTCVVAVLVCGIPVSFPTNDVRHSLPSVHANSRLLKSQEAGRNLWTNCALKRQVNIPLPEGCCTSHSFGQIGLVLK